MALICDTEPLYASADKDDAAHAACLELFETAREPLLVPAPVLVELDWLMTSRLGPAAFDAVLASIQERALGVEDLRREDYARIRELRTRYADLPLGFVDAAMVAVAERYGDPRLVSLDRRHFGVVRPRHAPAFELLPAL